MRATLRTFFICILLLAAVVSNGQDRFKLEFVIYHSAGQKVSLSGYYGDQRIKLDSATTDGNGYCSFTLGEDREPGIYRLSTGKELGMDFIFFHEDVYIEIDERFDPDSARVRGSVENEILFDYLKKKVYYEMRMELLGPVVYYYPQEDPFWTEADKEFMKLENAYSEYLEKIYDDHPDRIVTRFIRFDQLEDIRPGEISPQKTEYLRRHYFDGIDLTDTLLLYSPILPGRIIDYLSLYVSPGIGKEKQEELFKQAIDSLMDFTLPGNKVREVVVNYLVQGFQAYGMEDVLAYLVENYVLNESCVSEQREETLRKRVEGFKKLATGNIAPDFSARDLEGNPFRLSALDYPYKVLYFWSSDCPHCSNAIPGMKRLEEEYRDRAVFIAISVDEDEAVWKQSVAEKEMDWINIAELKGWDGGIVNDYYIYATPTILLLGRDLKILAKPNGVNDLELSLKKMATESGQ